MITSTQQKQELFRTIWSIADDLRGSVDGWDFKQYILGMLFYRFISENITNYINTLQIEAGIEGFDYAAMPDDEAEQGREMIVHFLLFLRRGQGRRLPPVGYPQAGSPALP